MVDDTLNESTLDDCLPFHNAGNLVITAGFVITTILFLPFGRGQLKETIIIQLLSFACLFVLLGQFFWEFVDRGLNYTGTMPWFGPNLTELAGVVLFNYAYSITIPAWLCEKKENVSVNEVMLIASELTET